jgi:hypothetical protein
VVPEAAIDARVLEGPDDAADRSARRARRLLALGRLTGSSGPEALRLPVICPRSTAQSGGVTGLGRCPGHEPPLCSPRTPHSNDRARRCYSRQRPIRCRYCHQRSCFVSC